jgi:uncharacterized protein
MPRTSIAVAACVVSLALGGAETEAGEKDEPPTLSVSGTGKISAAPDVAQINMGVQSEGKTAREALASNSEAMAALLETLKKHGVAAKDVQTTQIQVQPQYSQPHPGPIGGPAPEHEFIPRVVGYRVLNMVELTARDISRLGAVLDAVVQAGANQINGISFRIDQPEKLMDEARKRAMADAKHKAELLAGAAGVVLGWPKSISEAGATPPQPRMMYAARGMAMASPSVPVAAGEQDLIVSVQVVYEIGPPIGHAK